MGRKRRLQYVEPGESSSHVGSNEVPSREQAPPANDDRRQSQGSDDETQAPDTEDIPIPQLERLLCPINAGQPVGENAGPWAKWLGTVARKPDMCPINYRSWHKMPRQYKNRCWEATQAQWVIPTDRIPLADQRKWVLSRIGKLWRSHKSELKKKHYKLDTTKEELLQLSLPEVDDAQFHALVEYWFTDDFKDLSRDNKVRRGKQTEMHTLGSRSMARTADSIAKERGKQLERGELYEVAYSHRDGTAVSATAQANIVSWVPLEPIPQSIPRVINMECMVLTLDKGSWRKINIVLPFDCTKFGNGGESLCINGAIHWLTCYGDSIVAFDLKDENFRLIPLPHGYKEETYALIRLKLRFAAKSRVRCIRCERPCEPDDAFGQVIGAERGGRVRGVGFGPTPSSNRARTMDDSMPSPTSIATNQRVIELSSQVEAMKEKCARYDAEMRLMRKVLTSLCPSFPSDL
ncbi:hypothetical protein SO802_007348 [Lithocarpus litseifolius]|uniref:F-box associated beta-propeller type 3 domain-containing protein n=1 Tax=Lithocarpus litseifolius TaxID=425828 RepID=A0AAW2DNC7_9ROSI